ncbi:UNVERIFIED_CONTAM: hypothetical protein Sradi_0895400 [Sesamum radiatum]|uniref:Retrotransposon gag domain-containing protein n=1 Tax=Sesamum radiatum TaxID=300843 RepID=A0AAW2V2M8_SESRA
MERDKVHLVNSRHLVGAPHPKSKPLSMERSLYLVNNLHPLPMGEHPPAAPLQELIIQLMQEALLALIRDASTWAAAQAVAQFAAIQSTNPPHSSPLRSRELSSAPEEEEQRQEEVRAESLDQRFHKSKLSPNQDNPRPLPSRGAEDPYLPLVVAPPPQDIFAPAILVEALPTCVKVSNLLEYDGTGDPQEHLDKFYAKIDRCDLSDSAYYKVFRTVLSKRALAWFNQLPAGTISSLE